MNTNHAVIDHAQKPLARGIKLYYEARAELHAKLANDPNVNAREYHLIREREYRDKAGQL